MKKVFAFLITMSVLCTFFAGCEAQNDEETLSTPTGHAQTILKPDGSNATGTGSIPSQPSEWDNLVIDTVLYDENDIRVTVVGFERRPPSDSEALPVAPMVVNEEIPPEIIKYCDLYIDICIENNSDRNIRFDGEFFAVNGIAIGGYFLSEEIPAGQTGYDAIVLDCEILNYADIETLVSFESYVSIYDSDIDEHLYSASLNFETVLADSFHQPINDKGHVIFEAGGVTVAVQAVVREEGATVIWIFARNDGSEDVVLSNTGDVRVNGSEIGSFGGIALFKGTVGYESVRINDESLAREGIEEIESVRMWIGIEDLETGELLSSSEKRVEIYITEENE